MDEKAYIRDIQLAGLISLHKFDELCRRFEVSYFAISGTLLGAIRHKGYIPWDDDMDLGMLREEFNKLQRIPKDAWGDEIELVTAEMDDIKHDKLLPRIYLKKSKIQSYDDVKYWRNPDTKECWSTSLMIDLFIFDEIPDDEKKYIHIRNKIQKIRKKYKLSKLESNVVGKSGLDLVKSYGKRFYGKLMRNIYKTPWKRLNSKYINIVNNAPKGEEIGCYYSTFGHVKVKKNDIFPIQYTDFEDLKIPIPNNYLEFLELNYGKTYMSYPPESERYHINFIFVDLGNGKVFNIDPVPGSLGEKYDMSQNNIKGGGNA